MLTLTRRPFDAVVIHTSDGPVRVIVAGIRGNQVRLSFDAERLRIEREDHYTEVRDRKDGAA